MPENRGSTVQEQTARMVPDTAATGYATHFDALAPRYFMTDAWRTKTLMAPAMKSACTRHSSTWARAYSCSMAKDSFQDACTRGLSTGRNHAAANTATINPSFVRSRIGPTPLGDMAKLAI
jgi:hypothetical protein